MKRKLLTVFSMVFVLAGVLFLASCGEIGANKCVSQEVAEKEFGPQGGNRASSQNYTAKIAVNSDYSEDNETNDEEENKTEYEKEE